MNTHNQLVRNVLSNATLLQSIHSLDYHTLNLITGDWENKLCLSSEYQRFLVTCLFEKPILSESGFYWKQKLVEHSVNLLLVGRCSVGQSYLGDCDAFSVLVHANPVLENLMRAMTCRMKLDYQMPDTFRFFLDANHSLQLYDGKKLVRRSSNQISKLFANPFRSFVGILKLEIDLRYFYELAGEKVARLGGRIQDMVVIEENKFRPVTVDIGNVMPQRC